IVRPGERFAFRLLAFDVSGCPTDPHATWSAVTTGAKLTVSGAGVVAIADDAPDGAIELQVTAGMKTARAIVEIASPERYRALLAAADSDAGTGEEQAAPIVSAGHVGGATAIAEDG